MTTLQTCEQGLSMVHAEVFLAEEGVFKCMNMRDVDPLPGLELVEPMGSIGRRSEETM